MQDEFDTVSSYKFYLAFYLRDRQLPSWYNQQLARCVKLKKPVAPNLSQWKKPPSVQFVVFVPEIVLPQWKYVD